MKKNISIFRFKKLTTLEKGRIILDLLIKEQIKLMEIHNLFCLTPRTLEKYALDYLDTLENEEIKIEYLNTLAELNEFPSFQAAKKLIFTKNSPEKFMRMYKIGTPEFEQALKLVDFVPYYKELNYIHVFSVLEENRAKLCLPLSRYFKI